MQQFIKAIEDLISDHWINVLTSVGLTPVGRYLICLTNECDGDIRTRKLRAMVVRRELLLKLPDEPPAFESPHHSIRWQTLQHLQQRHRQEPWRFLEVELVV